MPSTCAFEGCDKPAWARGLCGTHYSRWRRRGDIEADIVRFMQQICSINGCNNRHQARGLCDTHYRRWLNHGDPLIIGRHGSKPGSNRGSANPQWKGDGCGYAALHLRIEAARGKARDFLCQCGNPARYWAYNHDDPDEQMDDRGWPFSRNVMAYSPMCSPCHAKLDHAMAERRRESRSA